MHKHFEKSFKTSMKEKEKAAEFQIMSIYWLDKEGVAPNKFGCMIILLTMLECPFTCWQHDSRVRCPVHFTSYCQ